MAVAHDATSESHTGTSGSSSEPSFQWNHTGAASGVKGVLIFVWNNANANNVTAVTYGGVTVPAVSGGEAADTAGEPGRSTAYYLGEGVPQGTQQVVVTRTNNATVMYATASTVLANQDTRVVPGSIVLTTGDSTVAEVAVTDAVGGMTGVNSLRFAGGHFGHQTPPTAGANSTLLQSIDIGAQCYLVGRESSAGTGSRNVGFSSGTSDDRAIVSLAIAETYTPTAAPLTLTGQVIALALGFGLAAGSLGMTGLAPSMLVGATAINVPAGAMTTTGYAPTTAFLGPTVGQLAFTGQVPTADVFQGFTPTPSAGSLVWAGLTPTVTVSSFSQTIAIPVGSQPYTGLAPTVRTGDLVLGLGAGQIVIKGPQRPEEIPRPDQGVLAYTGRVLNVAVDAPGSAITIQSGTLALSGQAPIRIANQNLAIPVGVLTLSGQYFNVAFKTPDAGSLVFQGLAPTLIPGSRTFAMPAGSLAYGGATLTPTLGFAFVQAIPAGQIVVTGLSPNAGTPFSLVIPTGSLVFTGRAPTVDWVTALQAGSLPYTGQTPSVQFATSAPGMEQGELVWQGYAPELVHSNGTVIRSTVSLVRSLSGPGTITRTVRSGVTR